MTDEEISDIGGLTDKEYEIYLQLVGVFNNFCELPKQHPMDMGEVTASIHNLQRILAIRIARRKYPVAWPCK